jgi:O-antigen biosynthesis protein WbqP
LPQLWSVLVGDMSLVGPRPALFNQDDLVALRTAAGVEALRPGVTGWAQINGRDEIAIPEKVALDAEYLRRQGFWFDLTILLRTVLPVVTGKGVTR